jgi:hypothetical protein
MPGNERDKSVNFPSPCLVRFIGVFRGFRFLNLTTERTDKTER